MPTNKNKVTKATKPEQIQEQATLIHGATEALFEINRDLEKQDETGTIDFFDDYTAEEYIQFKSDLRGLLNISRLLLDFLEEYEETYF